MASPIKKVKVLLYNGVGKTAASLTISPLAQQVYRIQTPNGLPLHVPSLSPLSKNLANISTFPLPDPLALSEIFAQVQEKHIECIIIDAFEDVLQLIPWHTILQELKNLDAYLCAIVRKRFDLLPFDLLPNMYSSHFFDMVIQLDASNRADQYQHGIITHLRHACVLTKFYTIVNFKVLQKIFADPHYNF